MHVVRAPPAHPPPQQQHPQYQQHNAYAMSVPQQQQRQMFHPTTTFGATKTRPKEREEEICRSAQYGTVSFAPQKPLPASKVNAPATVSTRPPSIPVPSEQVSDLPPLFAHVCVAPPFPSCVWLTDVRAQPTVAEDAFFARARAHLERKELCGTPSTPPSKHTPWTEFLKCLHMYAAHLLSREHLLALLSLLFVQGHADKHSTVDPKLVGEAEILLREFDTMMAKRGAFASQERAIQEKSRYGTANMKKTFDLAVKNDIEVAGSIAANEKAAEMANEAAQEAERQAKERAAAAQPQPMAVDGAEPTPAPGEAPIQVPPASYFYKAPVLQTIKPLSGVVQVTPSYKTLPLDYPQAVFFKFTGREEADKKVLNDKIVGNGKIVGSMETNDFKARSNCHEAQLLDLEEQRFEVDLAIDANVALMRQMEPVADEINTFRKLEEADGQPLGRMQYNLKRKTFTTSHLNAISRIYGEAGEMVLEHLKTNAAGVLPVVMPRLKQKDIEWREIRKQLNKRWKIINERCYAGSLDHVTAQYKKSVSEANGDIQLWQPWTAPSATPPISSQLDAGVFRDAYGLIASCTASDTFNTDLDCSRIWCEFMLPFFGYSYVALLGESHSEYLPPVYPNGTIVNTTFGIGKIVFYSNDRQYYKVELPYGTGFLNPNSIFYPMIEDEFEPKKDDDGTARLCARHNHRFKSMPLPGCTLKKKAKGFDEKGIPVGKQVSATSFKNAPRSASAYRSLLTPPPLLQTAFVTQSMYVVLKLFTVICEALSEINVNSGGSPRPLAAAAAKKGKAATKKGKAAAKKGKKGAEVQPVAMEVEPAAEVKADADAEAVEGEKKDDEMDVDGEKKDDEKEVPVDMEMQKIAGHTSNPDKNRGIVGLLQMRMRNKIDQTTFEAGIRQVTSVATEVAKYSSIPDLVVRCTDTMLKIIGADDEKEGSGNGFLRDIYLSTVNYEPTNWEELATSLKKYSADNARHGNFMETMFVVSFNKDTGVFTADFKGDKEALSELLDAAEKVEEEEEGGGAGGKKKRARTGSVGSAS